MTRENKMIWTFALAAAAFLSAPGLQLPSSACPMTKATSADAKTAQANPYPNDAGPDHLTADELKGYPADKVEGYKLLLVCCAQCHTPSRPLNSRFTEPEGAGGEAGEDATVAALKKSNPEDFADYRVRQIEPKIWSRYIHRMMNKPGCKITPAEGKKIWEFLVYDSSHRKLGANAAAWDAHQKELLEKFKKDHPDRYKELDQEHDL